MDIDEMLDKIKDRSAIHIGKGYYTPESVIKALKELQIQLFVVQMGLDVLSERDKLLFTILDAEITEN